MKLEGTMERTEYEHGQAEIRHAVDIYCWPEDSDTPRCLID
jgi:hypothetical protein